MKSQLNSAQAVGQRIRAERAPSKRRRAPKARDTLAGLPVSPYAPVLLHRPLELFGNTFLVHLSTKLTFNPDTVSRAVCDISLDAGMRRFAPAQHDFMRKLAHVATGRRRASKGLRALIESELVPAVPDSLAWRLRRQLAGETLPEQPSSSWRNVLHGLRRSKDRVLIELCSVLADCDAHGLYMRELAVSGQGHAAEAHAAHLLGSDIEAWVDLNPDLEPVLYVLVEVALKTLAWLECHLPQPERGADAQRSCVDALLEPTGRPIGNWLDAVCRTCGCANLGQLAKALLRRGAKFKQRPVTHDRLRKWASSTSALLPREAVPAVLADVNDEWDRTWLRGQFFVARLFTFLCDLMRAGTKGEPPAWQVVQAQVRSRYEQAYRLQMLHVRAAQQDRGAAP